MHEADRFSRHPNFSIPRAWPEICRLSVSEVWTQEMPCLALLTTSTRIMRIHAHPGRSPDRLQELHTLSNCRPLQIDVHCRQCLRFAYSYFQFGRIVYHHCMLTYMCLGC